MTHMKSLLGKLGVSVLVIGFPILCYGGNMIGSVGAYRLGQDVKTVRGLVEFTSEEYAAIWSFQGGVGLPGEKVFNAPKVTFNRHLWYLTVGTLNGRIFKLALQYISSNRAEAHSILEETLKFVKSQMGVPTEQAKTPGQYRWDSTDGIVVLAQREEVATWCINLLLTSHPVMEHEMDRDRKEALKQLSNDIVKFQKQQKYMQVMLCEEISQKLLKEENFQADLTEFLAAQIVNYYSGFDIDEQFKNMKEPNRSKVAKIRQWIIPKAEEMLKQNYNLRRLIGVR
jgi:hypothetical protein